MVVPGIRKYLFPMSSAQALRLVAGLAFLSVVAGCAPRVRTVEQDLHAQGSALVDRGLRYYAMSRYPEALQSFYEALPMAEISGNQFLTVDIHFKIGHVHLKRQEYRLAINAFESALASLKGSGGARETAILHNVIGSAYYALGEVGTARNHYTLALHVRREAADTVEEARTIANLGTTFFTEGRYIQAIHLYERAHTLLSEIRSAGHQEYAAVLTSLGALYAGLGQYDRALSLHAKAREHYEQTGDWHGVSTVLHNVGVVYFQRQEYAAAITAFEQALALHDNEYDALGRAETLNSLALALSEAHEETRAFALLAEAISLLTQIGARKQLAATLDSLGTLYLRRGNYPDALRYYHQSLFISRTLNHRDNVRITLGNIGITWQQQGQEELAILFFKESVQVTEEIRKGLTVLPLEGQRAYAGRVREFYRRLADLLLRQDRVVEAYQVLDLLRLQEVEEYLGPVRGFVDLGTGVPWRAPEKSIVEYKADLEGEGISIGEELEKLRRIPREKQTAEQQIRIRELARQEEKILQEFARFADSPDVRKWLKESEAAGPGRPIDLSTLDSLRYQLAQLGETWS